MGRNDKDRARRQARKQAKKQANRKEQKRKQIALYQSLPDRETLAKAQVLDCTVSRALFEKGIGQVVFSRKLAPDAIAVGVFLLDVFCLGVKDAFLRVVSRIYYEGMLVHMEDRNPQEARNPEYVCKLVTEAVRWSTALGFRPHPDFLTAETVFGDIDPAACGETFVFGQDGKPFYIQGPHDSPTRAALIMRTLEERCGRDGFKFILVQEDLSGY